MRKIKVGFFKAPQGVFTEKIIRNIENKLGKNDSIELYTGLDFRKGRVINGRVIVDNFDLNNLDVYFWHDAIKASEWDGDNYFLNVLKALENDCLVINSSEATRIVSDKFLSHNLLLRNNLPVIDFALVSFNKKEIEKIFDYFGGTIVIKPRFGSWGIGVEKISSKKELLSWFNKTKKVKNPPKQLLVEKYFRNDLSKWIAVVVLGEKVLFGYKKKITTGSDWKIYDPKKKDGKGAYSEYVDLPKELKKIALKAKEAVKKDIVGFDFIYTEEGYKIVDENGRPGIYPQCIKAGKINIEDEIVNLIISKVNTVHI